MACATVVKYREVPLLQHQIVKNTPKSIKVSSGGYHTMLVDSKTSEISGGFSFAALSKGRQKQTPFIYWRTLRETIYLTETCLHRNDVCHEVKITFEGSPIIAVAVHAHTSAKAFLLITTTTSFHRIPIDRPMHGDHQMHIEHDSILLKLNENVITDPLNCYTFINDVGQSLPVTASAIHCPEFNHTKFAIATISSLHLFTMELGSEKTIVKFVELEHKPLSISKFIHTIADSWRGKSHTSQVVTMCFGTAGVTDGHPLLYTLHRDGTLRVWLHCGRFMAAEYLSKYTQGSETEFHSCVLRGSTSLVALYFSFQTFSEFIILRPEATKDSLILQNAGTIMAPNFDLIDFKLTDHWLWALWCNAEGEMQTLAYALTTDERLSEKDANVWLPVVLENATEGELPVVDAGTDMRDLYCNRIFHSGLFPDKVIRKTLTMFNRNLAGVITGSTTGGTMVRLKRYVLACIESQLQQERSNIRQNTPLDDEQLLELSNGLWEKFYLYCMQYSYESSRPVGLFLLEEPPADIEGLSAAITVGIVRKKYISFFRPCDPLEVAYYTPPLAEAHDNDDAGLMGSGNELLSGEVVLLVNFLREMDQTFSPEQKHELDSYIHQRRGNKAGGDDLSAIGAAQNQELIHNMMPAFLQRMEDLPGSIGLLLRYLKPADPRDDMVARESESHVRISTGEGLASELALVAAKQMIQLRYLLLRNLLLLQHIVQQHANLSYDLLDPIQSTYRPDTETMLRCYHVMNWIAQTRIDLDWTKTTKIAASFPLNLRTSMSLLQAYAISRLNDETLCGVREFSVASCESSIGDVLPFLQKSNLIISYICPSSDDFIFGEWLSDNDLHVLIDEYVRLLSHWCEWNCCSRNFIQAKSYLMLGDTAKALDLFPLSLKGIQNERFLQKFLRQGDKNRTVSPYEMLGAFYLRLIRLFEYYGAYDGVMTLVHSAIDSTIQQKQQAMFQSIEFSSHIELGHYEEAYNALTKNCEPARKKDCLRQLICLLFSVRRLDILMDLPYYGLEEEFTSIVAMNARSADIADGVQYDFLYSFFTNKQNLRKAAITSYEEAMRNYAECNSYDHLNRYYGSLLKCLNSLAIINPRYAWLLRPLQENHRPQQLTSNSEDRIQIVQMKDLEEQLMSTHCALQLSQSSDGFKVVTSLEPIGLIALLLSRKLYHLASKLAHCRAPAMVSTVYEHLCSSCLAITGSEPAVANNTISWLNENCISDVIVGTDTASTAWNYLRHMLAQEGPEHAAESHLAVLNRVLSRGAYAPTWLKSWCFEHMPSQLIRAYLSHGRLEEAYEQTVELFQARFFSTGRFSHQTLFPLTVCEHLVYELEQAANYPKEKDHIERYLRMIEVTL